MEKGLKGGHKGHEGSEDKKTPPNYDEGVLILIRIRLSLGSGTAEIHRHHGT
jgi:hypothetical protein